MHKGLMSLVYANGNYWIYQASTLDFDSYMLKGSSIEESSNEFLKQLNEKAWQAIKFIECKERKQNGIVLHVGDIIKFGRVPFIVKESSVEKNIVH